MCQKVEPCIHDKDTCNDPACIYREGVKYVIPQTRKTQEAENWTDKESLPNLRILGGTERPSYKNVWKRRDK